jgi:hypothetical protein
MSSQPEDFSPARPDRAPTPDEEVAAEAAARDVDIDAVGDQFEHMAELGAEVRGEGEIEQSRAERRRERDDPSHG